VLNHETKEQLRLRLGRSRSHITNFLRWWLLSTMHVDFGGTFWKGVHIMG